MVVLERIAAFDDPFNVNVNFHLQRAHPFAFEPTLVNGLTAGEKM